MPEVGRQQKKLFPYRTNVPEVGGQQKKSITKGELICYDIFVPLLNLKIMDKKIALKIILESSKEYKTNLENCNLLFIYGDIKKPRYIETTFLRRNFLHLTGADTNIPANQFYEKALNMKLTEHNFEMKPDGTTELKLSVLPQMMYIDKNARMIGNYNNIKWELKTEKLVGNIRACIGFTKSKDQKYYIPNTLLKEDTRKVANHPQERILAVFKKRRNDSYYLENPYLAKGINVNDLFKNELLSSMITKPVETKSNVASLDKSKTPLDLNSYKQKAKEYNESRSSNKSNDDLEL